MAETKWRELDTISAPVFDEATRKKLEEYAEKYSPDRVEERTYHPDPYPVVFYDSDIHPAAPSSEGRLSDF